MMSITFNADEIFEMAEEIERNGAKFYRQAAKNSSDPKMEDLLLGFAEMEDNHEKTFTLMRAQLSAGEKEMTSFDPYGEAALYLQSIADTHGYEGKAGPDQMLTGNETPEEIFKIALGAEKNSVVFYLGLKGLVPAKAGKDKVDAIIKEEMQHITTLNTKLVALKK